MNNKQTLIEHLRSRIIQKLNEQSDTHQKIKDFLVNTLAAEYPHRYNEKSARFDPEASADHLTSILDATGPHTTAESAINAIRPHAIDGNYSLEERIYDTQDVAGDISEHPRYEEFVRENEDDYAEKLTGDLRNHLS